MFLSLIAVLIVFIAMPASLAVVETWNGAISNEYETYVEFSNETKEITGALFDMPNSPSNSASGSVYVHYNISGVRENAIQDVYDKSLFDDNMYRIVLSAQDTTDSSSRLDFLTLAINTTAYSIVANAANHMKIHIDAGKPVFVQVYYQDKTQIGEAITDQIELNSSTNYTYTTNIDFAKLLAVDNQYSDGSGHFTLVVRSYNETEELSHGDVVIIDWEFDKKRGSVATIYTVDNLMLGWGALLFIIGFASTPFFNPLSRDVFPFITHLKRSKQAKKAAAKRKSHRKKSSSRRKSSKRRRR
jgi:hypothetical protein